MGIVNNALIGASGQSGYNLTRSLRFRSSASAYLNRTPASAGNRKTWTWSAWVKLGTLGTSRNLFATLPASGNDDANTFTFGINSSNSFTIGLWNGSLKTSTPVYRDPSAWYHVVLNLDATNTASNLYINGQAITWTGAVSNTNYAVNAAQQHVISGQQPYSGAAMFDGYLAEVNFIDGQALTPSSFGSTNTLTGVWQPARYTGTYGTNGFYLPFTDNSALTTSSNVGLGKDFSGNGNYWTTNNISITAGVTYDSMTDVPTLTSATAANFAVLNPLDCDSLSTGSVVNGNLSWAGVYAGKNGHPIRSTFRTPSSGKWYVEARNVTYSGGGNSLPLGFTYSTQPITSASVFASTISSFVGVDASVFNNLIKFRTAGVSASLADNTTLFASYASGDVVNFAIDYASGKFWVGKNGTWYNSGDPAAGTNPTSTFTVGSGDWAFLAEYVSSGDNGNRSSAVLNFGQQPFTLTPPSGFVALNTFNLPTSTIVKGNTVMDATLYSGNNAATQTIVNAAGFQPDAVWLKSRSTVDGWAQVDSVRGVNKLLQSNNTNAESTTGSVTAFNSNGFSADLNFNVSGRTYVGYQWQAGQGTTSTNTSGTITSTVSVNASAGFSVVTWTGTGANATVGHGLGVAPSMVIVKRRDAISAWVIGVTYSGFTWSTDYFQFDTGAKRTNGGGTIFTATPTSTNLGVGTDGSTNSSGGTYVAYCWTPIAGYSAFGSYTGNGSTDGPFVYTGFRAKWIMVKRTDTTNNWCVYDTSRNPYNLTNLALYPDGSYAEGTETTNVFDLLSNGVKARGAGNAMNASGGTYIYMAFAETPTKFALAR